MLSEDPIQLEVPSQSWLKRLNRGFTALGSDRIGLTTTNNPKIFGTKKVVAKTIDKGTTCEIIMSIDVRNNTTSVTKKYIEKSEVFQRQLINEIKVLNHLSVNKFTVQMLSSNVSKKSITMEFLPYNLHRVLNLHATPTKEERQCYFIQICEAVEFLHGNGVVHRDLKLENIMLTEDTCHVKLVDFGSAVLDFKEECIGIRGSQELMAPEVLSSIKYDGKPVDCWSIGIIFFQMFNILPGKWGTKFPWKEARLSCERYTSFSVNDEKFPHITDMVEQDEDLHDLLLKLLSISVTDRITMANCLNHKYMKKIKNREHKHDRTLKHCKRVFEKLV
ncbi:hypothetical protein KAFR_0A00840 [Kazachstania africana CBS 2517]|uniref:non-specific serine/threonine protein kinase n=1 Tax=Kazachstania africana (strain ATCC 22294 / BCRC 22015 / CBS 2517 / CECT 1963 / NBRC 1671 / NRRL Y-8276) TaxID=1071382 RepID=H2AMC2_KAZAF|nr:hypothetical protein KAFR_0A00840 [Kazachstania africana CBS 2517]CCF55522.1 hypothetical protein KAFR_0A00840 [Kazachstania africana CBS 2517]